MTVKELVERIEEVNTFMKKTSNKPNYEDLECSILSIFKNAHDENFQGLSRLQKIHLFSWISNILCSCEYALMLNDEPTMDEEKHLVILKIISDLVDRAAKSLAIFMWELEPDKPKEGVKH